MQEEQEKKMQRELTISLCGNRGLTLYSIQLHKLDPIFSLRPLALCLHHTYRSFFSSLNLAYFAFETILGSRPLS